MRWNAYPCPPDDASRTWEVEPEKYEQGRPTVLLTDAEFLLWLHERAASGDFVTVYPVPDDEDIITPATTNPHTVESPEALLRRLGFPDAFTNGAPA